MRRAVLFDLDNTLHDRDAGAEAFLRAQHSKRGFCVPVGEWVSRFQELEERGRVWKDVVYQKLCGEYALGDLAEVLLAEYEMGFASFVSPYEGLRETLFTLRGAGWRTGVVTNGRSGFQRRTLAALGIEPLLDVVLVSEECGMRKPEVEIFWRALEILECEASGSWFVGDDPGADVEGALSAGLQTLWFCPVFEAGGVRRLWDVVGIVGDP